jgi:hypothetical protein
MALLFSFRYFKLLSTYTFAILSFFSIQLTSDVLKLAIAFLIPKIHLVTYPRKMKIFSHARKK